MSHDQRETEEDRKHQKVIMKAVAKHYGAELQVVETLGKYKIDGILYNGREVIGYVEAKWLKKDTMFGINVPKYVEGCQLAAYSKVPFMYAVRIPGKCGISILHDGIWAPDVVELKHSGGTPPGKDPNWDDKEPMMMINRDSIEWIS